GRKCQRLGVVVAQISDLGAARLDGDHLVTMVDNLAAAGHEDVAVVGKEGLEGLVSGLRIAEILQVNGWRSGGFGSTRLSRDGGCGAGGGHRGINLYRAGIGREDVAAGASVGDLFARGKLFKVDGRVKAGIGKLF